MRLKLTLLLAVLILWGCGPHPRAAPAAVDGVLDLRDWDFEHDGPVAIKGDWNFYWKQLLEPTSVGTQALRVDGIWNGIPGPNGQAIEGIGYGTYRLKVLLAHERLAPDLALRLRTVMSAHRLWLDGEEVTGSGVVSADLDNANPATPNQFHVLPLGQAVLNINLQVANPQFRLGGIRRPVQIGLFKDVFELHTNQIIYDAVIFTFLFAAGGYFLLMFAARPRAKERYRLYFGLFCVATALRATVAGDSVLADIFWPGMSWHSQIMVEYSANFLGSALITSMVASLYPEEMPRSWLRALQILAGAMVLIVLTAPVQHVVKMGPIFNFIALNSVLLMIITLVKAIRASRESALLLFLTIFIFVAGMLIDILRSDGFIYSNIEVAPAAFAAVILVQSIIFARAFTRAFSANERLSVNLGIANEDLKLTNEAVQRFVPYEFLALLKRASIREVARGDSAAMQMEILFCDLRDFTTIIEKLPASQAFAFINDWLAHMEPAIQHHQGFVNQYLGDCIMALFDSGADKAVRAGIAMLQALRDFNAAQLHVPGTEIRIGIGLNTGPIMLGTIGGRDRLDSGVVGDAVNVASRVEGMTKIYGAPFLITDLTLARLQKPDDFCFRELDIVAAKGKVRPVRIYEVLDGLPTRTRDVRLATSLDFSSGLEAYRHGDFSVARSYFQSCLSGDPDDVPAKLYVQRCSTLLTQPPSRWDGISQLTEK